MSQAPQYTPATDFSEEESLNAGGRSSVNTAKLDAELAAIAATCNALRANLQILQRDDTKLRDGIVEIASLSAAVIAFLGGSDFNPRGNWVTGTLYTRLDMVTNGGSNYVALTTHTAGASFASDLAAGRWQLFVGQATADGIAFTPGADLSSTTVQDAIEEVQASQQTNTRALLAYNYGAL